MPELRRPSVPDAARAPIAERPERWLRGAGATQRDRGLAATRVAGVGARARVVRRRSRCGEARRPLARRRAGAAHRGVRSDRRGRPSRRSPSACTPSTGRSTASCTSSAAGAAAAASPGQTDDDYRFLERSLTALRHVTRAFDEDLRASTAGAPRDRVVDRGRAPARRRRELRGRQGRERGVDARRRPGLREGCSGCRSTAAPRHPSSSGSKALDGLEDTLAAGVRRPVGRRRRPPSTTRSSTSPTRSPRGARTAGPLDWTLRDHDPRPEHPRLRLRQLLRRPPRGARARSPPPTTATRSRTARTSTPSACRRSSPTTSARASRRSPSSTAPAPTSSALQSMLPRWGAVIAASTAHINVDEGGAPERVAGIKLLTVADRRRQAHARAHRPRGVGLGRRAPRAAARRLDHAVDRARHALHARRDARDRRPRPRARHAPAHGRRAHLERGRVPRAAAARLHARRRRRRAELRRHQERGHARARRSSCSIPRHPTGLTYLRKLNMQLASKMRFVSAQLIALLEGDLWLRNASHANAMAQRLRAGVEAGLADGIDPRASRSPSRRSRTACSRRCPTASPTACANRSASTTGMPRRTRCAGCAAFDTSESRRRRVRRRALAPHDLMRPCDPAVQRPASQSA